MSDIKFDHLVYDAQKVRASGSPITSITETAIDITTTSQVVVSSDSSRVYTRIQNDDATNNVYLALGGTATTNRGIKLTPGDAYEISLENRYTGDIAGISNTTSTKVLVDYS